MSRLGMFLFMSGGAIALMLSPIANAQSCSNRSLNGSYGYTVTGTITTSQGPLVAGPFAAVGRITFDGSGNVSTVRSLSDNGPFCKATRVRESIR